MDDDEWTTCHRAGQSSGPRTAATSKTVFIGFCIYDRSPWNVINRRRLRDLVDVGGWSAGRGRLKKAEKGRKREAGRQKRGRKKERKKERKYHTTHRRRKAPASLSPSLSVSCVVGDPATAAGPKSTATSAAADRSSRRIQSEAAISQACLDPLGRTAIERN